jgi:hypothetical protein
MMRSNLPCSLKRRAPVRWRFLSRLLWQRQHIRSVGDLNAMPKVAGLSPSSGPTYRWIASCDRPKAARLETAWVTTPLTLRGSYLASAWECANAAQRLRFVMDYEQELGDAVVPIEEASPEFKAEVFALPRRPASLPWHDSRQRTKLARRLVQLSVDHPTAADTIEALLRELGLPKSFKRGLAPGDRPPANGWARYR